MGCNNFWYNEGSMHSTLKAESFFSKKSLILQNDRIGLVGLADWGLSTHSLELSTSGEVYHFQDTLCQDTLCHHLLVLGIFHREEQ